MKTPSNLGQLLLPIWLIVYGLLSMPLLHLSFAYSHDLLAIFAIVVGVLLIMKR